MLAICKCHSLNSPCPITTESGQPNELELQHFSHTAIDGLRYRYRSFIRPRGDLRRGQSACDGSARVLAWGGVTNGLGWLLCTSSDSTVSPNGTFAGADAMPDPGYDTHKRKFGNNDGQDGQKVDDEVGKVVVGIMGAQQKEHNGNTKEKLLGGRVLGTVVDLLPHVEVIEGTTIEFEGDSSDIVEHDVGADHVGNVGKRPRRLLRDAGDDIVKDLEGCYQNKMNGPRSYVHMLAVVFPGPSRGGLRAWPRSAKPAGVDGKRSYPLRLSSLH